MNEKENLCDIIIFGGHGDLALRKLMPACYHLYLDGYISKHSRIVTISRRKINLEDHKKLIKENLKKYLKNDLFNEEIFKEFSKQLHCLTIDLTKIEDYKKLSKLLNTDSNRNTINYLATAPSLFGTICKSLKKWDLITENTRVVLEKPIGRDLESSKIINDEVAEVFEESNIYRIDHYLVKDTVQNILAMRFSNALFMPLWSSRSIDHVQITVGESVGVESRWSYYDDAGALRDMVQNHLLQLLCLIAMEPPCNLEGDSVRDEKLKVLRSLRPITANDIKHKTVRGQYKEGAIEGKSVVGYLEEEGCKPDSQTETFVALRADIDNWRWSGVPFYLRTGKRMAKRYSEIVIQFKEVPHSIFPKGGGCLEPNRLIIRLQPQESIELKIMNKIPGHTDGMRLRTVGLELSTSQDNPRTPDAYEYLLLDVIRSNPTLFMRRDEIEAAWRWCDNILHHWQEQNIKVKPYTAGTFGPSSSIALIERDGRSWYEE